MAITKAPVAPVGLRQLVDDAFRGLAGSAAHPCMGARSVVHRGAYRLALYDRLGSTAAAAELAGDLAAFGEGVRPGELTSFVAVFESPAVTTEAEFSTLLWQHLQALHEVDRHGFAWDPTVSADPNDPRFSFSVGGHAYFVIGLHAGSSRWARRLAWPALVFNPHSQFVAMREAGRYDRIRRLTRERDVALQGTSNPALADHGTGSEATQYAGDDASTSWRCPLDVRAAP